MIPSPLVPLANHLWQSTIFAALAGLLTLLLRANRARVRYWLWLSASVKLLIPFSILVAVGGLIGRHSSATPAPSTPLSAVLFRSVVQPVGEPFSTAGPQLGVPMIQQSYTNGIVTAFVFVWAIGFVALVFRLTLRWRRIDAATSKASPIALTIGLPAKSSHVFGEPGVFGIFRPILLLPEGIVECLTAQELQAIVAHEVCHVRYRDNLMTAIHLAVEALFWFHPLVWWLGARLLEERERACDEEVLRTGQEPRIYAEGILKICELYLASPLDCAAGVTGSDIKKRIEEIMVGRVGRELIFGQKLLLASVGMVAITAPLLFGALNAFSGQAPLEALQQPTTPLAFEVASVKPNKSQDSRRSSKKLQFTPGGGLIAVNLPLDGIIGIAYNVSGQTDRLSGGPDWIHSEKYDIEAAAEQGAIPAGSSAKIRGEKTRLMLQTLLVDRFKLVIRREMKERSVFALVVAKNGSRLQKADTDENSCALDSSNNTTSCHLIFGGEGQGLHGSAVDISDLALAVSDWTDRPVVDRTGLRGLFNIQTEGWAPLRSKAPLPGEAPSADELAFADLSRPTLVVILQRLGLKLEPQHAPTESFVIEHVERPTQN